MTHDRALWVLQWLFGVYFIAIGIVHFVVPEGLPAQLAWMYELSDTLHVVTGIAEILGGLGLILPSVTRIRPELTPLAGIGLIVIMAGAAVWHVGRGEVANVGINLVNALFLAYITYGRAKLAPLASRAD